MVKISTRSGFFVQPKTLTRMFSDGIRLTIEKVGETYPGKTTMWTKQGKVAFCLYSRMFDIGEYQIDESSDDEKMVVFLPSNV